MMRKIFRYTAALLMLCTAGRVFAQEESSTKGLIVRAKAFFRLLEAKQYDSCERMFDSSLIEVLDADKLKKNWEPQRERMGKLLKQEGELFESQAPYYIVYLGCHFEQSSVDLKVVFSAAGKILGFFVVPSKTKEAYTLPSYAHPDSVIEREVIVETDSFKLGGTLMAPRSSAHPPIVVFVQGSGPTDRDESIKSNKDFEDIAYGLANFGIASLRYDKRTLVYGGSRSAGGYENLTPKEEVVDDALSALALARGFPEVNPSKVFLLGHSLGAMMAPKIAQLDGHLSGVIMMAAPARAFEDIVLEQMEYLLPQQLSKEKAAKAIEEVRAMVTRVKTHHYGDTTASSQLFDLPPKYWDYLRLYDQVKTASILAEPMLIMQGDKDYQVSQKEYDMWKLALGGKNNVTFMMFPGLYHLFMPGKGTYTDYDVPSHVTEEVTATIAKWVLQH